MASFATIYLESANTNFQDLLSNSRQYSVPQFQRDYSWQKEEWQDLWDDIQALDRTKQQHFMGHLVLQATDSDENFIIVDGQQRITTLIIIMVAATKRLEQFVECKEDVEDNEKRIAECERLYLTTTNIVSLVQKPKLKLNRHNYTHFKDILRVKESFQQLRLNVSNQTLNKAITYFGERVRKYDNGKAVAKLIETISKGLLFTTITVKDDVNAYMIFETLNARGVELSAPDLIKNYLMSLIAQEDRPSDVYDDFEEQWGAVVEQLGDKDFTDFLRSYRGMRSDLPAKRDLFRILKQSITNPEQAVPYVDDLKKYAPLYVALKDERDEFWKESGDVVPHLEVLNLFGIKTPLSLLMAAYYKLSADDFRDLVQQVAICSFRYNAICNKLANEQEKIYNKMAMELMSKDEPELYELTPMLASVYPDKEEFLLLFRNKELPGQRSPKKVRYILGRIEKHLQGGQSDIPDEITMEHVLPNKPSDEWQESFGTQHYLGAINRLGNLALLTEGQNLGQESFEQKRAMLAETSSKINQHIAQYEVWDIDTLDKHQKWLAKHAQALWNIPQLE